eukprot:CAMPEP_0183464274 /NCGR_PEP_ID=MMETSP0370-20130417/145086_1 /TAXON_ID=268820 /ORGANISM="Peridinium aciculiferum, Strain PAER-2" /LENGTH=32 /DNA_ID= /DNA_START= /DNA_END= /DNA_ORIENTATION=
MKNQSFQLLAEIEAPDAMLGLAGWALVDATAA